MGRRGCVLLLCVLLALASAACNKKYDIVPVKGQLTYDGQGVPDMIVRFEPVEGRPSDSFTTADGSFEMGYTLDRMGVEVDTHRVTVIWAPPDEKPGTRPSEIQKKVLADFKTNGPIEVKIDKPNRDFEIKLPRGATTR